MAAGLHAGWNVALGMIVSVPVSGITLATRLLDSRLQGGPLSTGGEFGFESSVLGVAILFLAGWVSWKRTPPSPGDRAGSPSPGS